MAIIEKKYQVGVKDVGSSNLITNKGILNLFEDLACIHSDMAGYGINQMTSTHLSWVLLNWKIQVFKRVTYNSTVTVKTWARPANKFFTLRDFEMYDDEGNLICIASSKWTLVSTDNGSIVRITPEVIDCYKPEEKSVFEENDIAKLKEPDILKQNQESSNCSNVSYTFTVQRRDIDMNSHMHNLYYLDYAIEALPEEIYPSLVYSDKLEIMYKSGAKLGDNVNCFYAKQEDSHFVVMRNLENAQLHAIVKF